MSEPGPVTSCQAIFGKQADLLERSDEEPHSCKDTLPSSQDDGPLLLPVRGACASDPLPFALGRHDLRQGDDCQQVCVRHARAR